MKATDKTFADAVESSLARMGKVPYVTKVQSFYDPGLPFLVSKDNHTTYAIVTMKGTENYLEQQTPDLRKLAGYLDESLQELLDTVFPDAARKASAPARAAAAAKPAAAGKRAPARSPQRVTATKSAARKSAPRTAKASGKAARA